MILPSLILILFFFCLIANMIFSAALSAGQYGWIVSMRRFESPKNFLIWAWFLNCGIVTKNFQSPFGSTQNKYFFYQEVYKKAENYITIIWTFIEHNTIKMIFWECNNWSKTNILVIWSNIRCLSFQRPTPVDSIFLKKSWTHPYK